MKKGLYILPNLFTSANLFCGFFSMIAASNGRYGQAALAILFAVVLDCLDGKVARLTNSSSAFGVEYDSLADLLSFGVAPGWLLYAWALRYFEPLGWVAAFLFIICGALRLARFNVQASGVQKYVFTGLPIPAAASVVASAVLLSHQPDGGFHSGVEIDHPLLLGLSVYVLALLMVSNFRYRSLKRIRLKRAWSISLLLAGVAGLVGIALAPEISLFVLSLGYALSGPVETLVRRKRPKEDVVTVRQ
jgi:CDP-diacylglycerol--serine O-phosphatidyltransferase